jgi:hypothetical protein
MILSSFFLSFMEAAGMPAVFMAGPALLLFVVPGFDPLICDGRTNRFRIRHP